MNSIFLSPFDHVLFQYQILYLFILISGFVPAVSGCTLELIQLVNNVQHPSAWLLLSVLNSQCLCWTLWHTTLLGARNTVVGMKHPISWWIVLRIRRVDGVGRIICRMSDSGFFCGWKCSRFLVERSNYICANLAYLHSSNRIRKHYIRKGESSLRGLGCLLKFSCMTGGPTNSLTLELRAPFWNEHETYARTLWGRFIGIGLLIFYESCC